MHKDKERRSRAYYHRKSPIYKGRQKLREKETMKEQSTQKAINKMTFVRSYILILTLSQRD